MSWASGALGKGSTPPLHLRCPTFTPRGDLPQACWSLPPQLVCMGPLLCPVSSVQISVTYQQFSPSSPQLRSLGALSDTHPAERVMDLKDSLLCHTHAWELSKGPPGQRDLCMLVPHCLSSPSTLNLSLGVLHVLQKTQHAVPPRPPTPSGTIYKASGCVPGDAMSVSRRLLSLFQVDSSHFLSLSSDGQISR